MGAPFAFHLQTRLPAARVLQALHDRLSRHPSEMSGVVCDQHVELYVPTERQHLWSPQLQVEVRPSSRGALLGGRFALHPHVWALDMALLGIGATLAFASLCLGYASWMMDRPPWALGGLLGVGVAWMLLREVRRAGTPRRRQQEEELRQFLEASLLAAEGNPSSVRPDGIFTRAESASRGVA